MDTDLKIKIALSVFGFVGAIVAIGGETWRKGESRFHKKLTERGWIAILCLALTLTFGVWKGLRQKDAAGRTVAELEQRQKELDDAKVTRDLAITKLEGLEAVSVYLQTASKDEAARRSWRTEADGILAKWNVGDDFLRRMQLKRYVNATVFNKAKNEDYEEEDWFIGILYPNHFLRIANLLMIHGVQLNHDYLRSACSALEETTYATTNAIIHRKESSRKPDLDGEKSIRDMDEDMEMEWAESFLDMCVAEAERYLRGQISVIAAERVANSQQSLPPMDQLLCEACGKTAQAKVRLVRIGEGEAEEPERVITTTVSRQEDVIMWADEMERAPGGGAMGYWPSGYFCNEHALFVKEKGLIISEWDGIGNVEWN